MYESSMEEFYQDPVIKEAIENGLLKELVSNDKICICNAANTSYFVFIYYKDKLNNQIGFLVTEKMLRNYIEDNDYFFKLYLSDNKIILDDIARHSGGINKDTLAVFYEMQEKHKDVPNSSINLELDEELLSLQKS